ncbi:hypothetical protein GCM10007304_08470 [Rhodococcoides trifolii]|uniref:Uncharacterized protein n=1 Tax=Rhodococcoides trifolii TaxID=908250 RepID=A0A917CT02_9NOCA|nr:hypothetical protein [Rhodococcus trifolii]GGF96794.1 hypothetical protein GCM10007304_08470 [Rhodococcus trifolii]
MTAHRTHLIRSATVACALAGAVVAGAAPASAEPAYASQFIRTNYLVGSPFPFAYEILEAATNGTGVVRLTAGELCNQLGPRCAGYSSGLTVQWINFASGASGATEAGSTPTTITTGGGPVGIAVSAVGAIGVPGFGIVNP